MKKTLSTVTTLLFTIGCTTQDHYLIASTGTVIGVELSQQTATEAPQATLGYRRAELAIVPTNRPVCTTSKGAAVICDGDALNGAADTGEVIMELRYGGIFSWGSDSGIYQRLAVGETAVKQPGAKYMFAKATDGTITPETAESLARTSEAQIEVQARSKQDFEQARQDRVDGLLDLVDALADARAIDIEKNPPVENATVDKIVAARDPGNQRALDADVARSIIKTRLIYVSRDEQSLNAWEAVLRAE